MRRSSCLKRSPSKTSGLASSARRSTSACFARSLAAAAIASCFWVRRRRISISISFLLSWIAAWYNQADAAHSVKGSASWGWLSSLRSSSETSSVRLGHLTAKCWSRMLCCEVFLHSLIHSFSPKIVKFSLHAFNLIEAVAVAFSLPAWTKSWISLPHSLSLALISASHSAAQSTNTWFYQSLVGHRV